MTRAPCSRRSVQRFLAALHALPAMPNVFNPWRDHDPLHDVAPDAPLLRSSNLTDYLLARAEHTRFVLVAEAPGYQGAKHSGIAMTSERILLGHVPEVPPSAVFTRTAARTSRPERLRLGAAEPTATIVWKQMLGLLGAQEFVLWNAFPCHPHKPGQPLTNRKPAAGELATAAHILPQMLALYPGAQVVALGNVARDLLQEMGIEVAGCARHPANGGATKFRAQLAQLAAPADVPTNEARRA